ncbi:hypothetical protein F2Q68_00016198, partial [Brassica cretica]
FQLMLGTASPWLGQSLVVFDVVFLVVGLPSIVSTRLGFQDLVFGAFLDASSLEPTWCDSLSHGATALGSDGAGGGVDCELSQRRWYVLMLVVVARDRSIGAVSVVYGCSEASLRTPYFLASLSSWLVFKFDLWNLVDRFRWPVLLLFFSLIFMLSPVQSSTMLLVWRSLCLYAKSSLALLEIGWCVVECFSNGLERMSANDAAKISKIEVWWDMKDCPIPEGYDARRSYVRTHVSGYGGVARSKSYHIRSVKSCKDTFLLYYANWRWKQLLEKGGGEPLVDRLSAMFYCKSCDFDCQSLEKFRKHLSSYKHGREEFIRTSWYTQLVCVTKTWRRNYRATPEHATAKIQVWWDMDQCPIPEGYDARLVRPSIEAAFKEIGYSGPVSITAYADHKETPNHVLLALSSTGVDVAHTLHS